MSEWYEIGYRDGYEGDAMREVPKGFRKHYNRGYLNGEMALQEDLDTNWGMGEDW